MKYNVMRKWVKALRSGKFKQGKSKLADYEYDDNGETISDELSFCCLGVLCKINDIEINIGQDELLGENAMQALGFKSEDGKMKRTYASKDGKEEVDNLASLNDLGLSFAQIANIIERNYKDL